MSHIYDNSIIWALSSETVPSSMRKMCRFTSSCTCAKSHPGICSHFKHYIVSTDSVALIRLCVTQPDLVIRCRHMPVDVFSQGAIHLTLSMLGKISSKRHFDFFFFFFFLQERDLTFRVLSLIVTICMKCPILFSGKKNKTKKKKKNQICGLLKMFRGC